MKPSRYDKTGSVETVLLCGLAFAFGVAWMLIEVGRGLAAFARLLGRMGRCWE